MTQEVIKINTIHVLRIMLEDIFSSLNIAPLSVTDKIEQKNKSGTIVRYEITAEDFNLIRVLNDQHGVMFTKINDKEYDFYGSIEYRVMSWEPVNWNTD